MPRGGPPQYSTDCRYFANGICSRGNACSFVHDVATRAQNICQFNLEGKCSFGHACRFKHTRPQNTERSPPTNRSSSVITSQPPPPPFKARSPSPPGPSRRTIRPVQLEKPGLNVQAVEFIPSWKKMGTKAPPISYAAAAACSSSSSTSTSIAANQDGQCSSSSTPNDPNAQAQLILCPYHEKNGDCNRKDFGCPFAHGDKCDMCQQWSLHPFNSELRKIHQNECVAAHTQEMERAFLLQKTESKTCGICMENIYEKNLRFGILNGCQHCFCLDCIRQWRTRDQVTLDLATKTVRSCPECRQHSDYVIPSLFWVESGQEKDLLIAMYKENTKSKVCKYYSQNNARRGNCPFGNKCFYKHQLPDGSIDPGESPHARRRARLVDYIFNDMNSDSDDEFSEPGDAEAFQRYLDDMASDTDEGEFFRSISVLIRELRGDDDFRRPTRREQ